MKAQRSGMSSRRARPVSRNAMLNRLASKLYAELRKVKEDFSDGKAVHDARVAARRLLATGEFWASHVPCWGALRDRVRRILKRLGRLRNLDVAIRYLDRGSAGHRRERRALGRHLRKLRRKERRAVGAWLTGRRINRVRKAAKGLRTEARTIHALHPPGPEALAPRISRVVTLFAGSMQEERMHEIRREVRRLRYGLESLQDAYDPADFRRLSGTLRRVQELAGDWHDRCVLADLGARAARNERVKIPLAGLLGRVDDEAKSLAVRFLRAAAELSELRGIVAGGRR